MSRFARHALAVLPALLLSSGSRANDNISEPLETGGLRFQNEAEIVMRSEDLRISEKEIRIVYRFFNNATEDKTMRIAFPMPDIVNSEDEENIALPTEDPENIFDFHVTADGHAVAPHLQQAALARGVDQSARLRKFGISLMPYGAILDRIPRASWPELVALGIASTEAHGNGGEPASDHLYAGWTLRSAYTWTQTFPARRETVLEQTYRPSIGESEVTSVGIPAWRRTDDGRAHLATYCVDDEIIVAIERASARSKAPGRRPYRERHMAFTLKTGVDWAGSIGDFHLTVDKGTPDNLVSFCADRVKKTSATQFETHHTNFIPTRDLNIVIFIPIQN